ncbi:MAG: ABC transporter ATP-binding protein [Lachnospiraceae bacterium]|nr:ABC transporter ATP-binding protein [Lachnospiraceae bacterium]
MISTILGEVKEYKTASLLTPLFMILEVVVETLIPLLMATIIDSGIGAGSMPVIASTGTKMLCLALVGLFAGIMGAVLGSKASAGLAKNLRKALFTRIQTFSFANIDKYSPSGLVTRMTTDVTNVQNAYMMLLRMFVRAPFSMIVAMIMAYRINARIANIYLVAVILLAVFLVLVMRRTGRAFGRVFPRYDKLNESVQENISSIRVVKAFVSEEHEKTRFRAAAEAICSLFMDAEKGIAIMMPVMTGTVYAVILLISWTGANMIVNSELTTGELTSLLAYCMNILMSLMMMGIVFVMVTMSQASAERISEVLSDESTLTSPDNAVMTVADGSVDFDHVEFRYSDGSEKVLHDIDIHIKSGETIGIIGGTGSAKSTLVNLIPRLYDATGGCVKVGGRDVREYDLDTLRNSVAVVLQQNVLFSGTILDNLRWGRKDATEEECMEACRMAGADGFVKRFPDGLHTMIAQGGSNVSGGQRQRLCIARALLKDPKILILDDSTSAVDTATDARIRANMAAAKPGMTKIIISQRIVSVEHADRVIVMDSGRLSGFDTPERLLADNKIYREIYETQKEGSGDFDIHDAASRERGEAAEKGGVN